MALVTLVALVSLDALDALVALDALDALMALVTLVAAVSFIAAFALGSSFSAFPFLALRTAAARQSLGTSKSLQAPLADGSRMSALARVALDQLVVAHEGLDIRIQLALQFRLPSLFHAPEKTSRVSRGADRKKSADERHRKRRQNRSASPGRKILDGSSTLCGRLAAARAYGRTPRALERFG